MVHHVEALFPVLLKTMSDNSDEVGLILDKIIVYEKIAIFIFIFV